MMASTSAYSSPLSPNSWASAWLTSRALKPRAPTQEAVEQRQAVGAADQRIDQVLGMRHQAEDAQVRAEDAGDVAGAAVAVGRLA